MPLHLNKISTCWILDLFINKTQNWTITINDDQRCCVTWNDVDLVEGGAVTTSHLLVDKLEVVDTQVGEEVLAVAEGLLLSIWQSVADSVWSDVGLVANCWDVTDVATLGVFWQVWVG